MSSLYRGEKNGKDISIIVENKHINGLMCIFWLLRINFRRLFMMTLDGGKIFSQQYLALNLS